MVSNNMQESEFNLRSSVFVISVLPILLAATGAFAFFSICYAPHLKAQDSYAVEDLNQQQYQTYLSIENSVLSPYCPGRLLRDCPSGAASILKGEVRKQILAGESEAQIVSGLYQRFGEEIRGAPGREGFGLIAWLMPIVFVVLGLLILLLWSKRLHGQQPATEHPETSKPNSTELEARIQKELDDY